MTPGILTGLRMASLFAPILAALIVRTDRRLVAELRDAQALSPQTARMIASRSRLGAARLRRLMRVGAIVALPDGRHYLNEEGWVRHRYGRRRRALTAVTAALLVGLIAYLFGAYLFAGVVPE